MFNILPLVYPSAPAKKPVQKAFFPEVLSPQDLLDFMWRVLQNAPRCSTLLSHFSGSLNIKERKKQCKLLVNEFMKMQANWFLLCDYYFKKNLISIHCTLSKTYYFWTRETEYKEMYKVAIFSFSLTVELSFTYVVKHFLCQFCWYSPKACFYFQHFALGKGDEEVISTLHYFSKVVDEVIWTASILLLQW